MGKRSRNKTKSVFTGFFMFKNRFLRFLSTIIIFIVYEIFSVVFGGIVKGVGQNQSFLEECFGFMPVLLALACLVGQFFGDILNVDNFLNETFCSWVKRICFFIASGLALAFGAGVILEGIPTLEKPSVFGTALILSWSFSALLTYIGYAFIYPSYGDKKYRLPLYYAFSIVIGYILGLVFAILSANLPEVPFGTYIFIGACIVYVVGIIRAVRVNDDDKPFAELGDDSPLSMTMDEYFNSDEWMVKQEEYGEYQASERIRRNPSGRVCCQCKQFYLNDDLKGMCYICGRVSSDHKACHNFDPN